MQEKRLWIKKFSWISLFVSRKWYTTLGDVFENFREICLKIYHLDPTKFLSAPRLAWQAALKMTEIKSELLTDIDMLLMVEKGIRGEICHAIPQYAKANNKYMKE